MIPWLSEADPFPPVSQALTEPDGLLAAGGELSSKRIVSAYRQGIFPWFSEGQPVLWWCTDPRMVLFTDEFRLSRSLRKSLARFAVEPGATIRVDCAFEEVMRACARPRHWQSGTWINESMIEAYVGLHRQGIAHSVEAWSNGALVGGLYGLAIGSMFYGESMFAIRADASKIALAYLVALLRDHQFPMIDCQQQTSHLASLGARPIARDEFVARLRPLVDRPGIGDWPNHLDAHGAVFGVA